MKHFLLSRAGVHNSADKKCKRCLGKLWFKGQLQADSFLVELIFILLSPTSQGDRLITWNWIICYYFTFTAKPLQLNQKKKKCNSTALQIREEKKKVLLMFAKVNVL